MNIRNFVIIAHVDHGKSTLADRLLEITGTVEARRMKPQYLDQLELERERGITIKMAPVRMEYHPSTNSELNPNLRIRKFETDSLFADDCVLNLIDTPGHSDFSYEVSRALQAVEGAILLVDASQGIQAQTLAVYRHAQAAGLAVVGAVNKVDLPGINVDRTAQELADLIGAAPQDIHRISGKTGAGVPELLDAVVVRVPPPRTGANSVRGLSALVFDSQYDDHRGILAYVRVLGGQVRAGDTIRMVASGATLKVREVGCFAPEFRTVDALAAGEIGYIATGLKEPALVKIGDTITHTTDRTRPLPGYREPTPVVFVAFYPDGGTKFEDLKRALDRLHLNDPALRFEPDANEALGRGLKVGFLGQLHFEITSERLTREFGLTFLTSFPSIAYRLRIGGQDRVVASAADWPATARIDAVHQPMIRIEILTPSQYLNDVLAVAQAFDLAVADVANFGESLRLQGQMPLAELIRDFDDRLKSASSGFASFSYELAEEAAAQVVLLEILIAGEAQPALTRVVPRRDVEWEARQMVERLRKLLPQQQFTQAIQARVDGRIIARETIAALRKDVTGYLYGGDRSRKMKLWKKQQRGKEKLKTMGRVSVPVAVFREVLKK
ncbi:MAG: elongation factor 4 [Candidatus Liptonbacteria bacterium]|nr:elongation factor 4 [Candidatus Liptonbacteria bacterium]